MPHTRREPLTFLMVIPGKGAAFCGDKTEISTTQPLREVRKHGFEACDAEDGRII